MTYTLDTPYSNQVIFLNSQNSILKTIDGVGHTNTTSKHQSSYH